jgi:Sortase domain
VAARPRPTGLATIALVAGLVLVLVGLSGAVDSRTHPSPRSATLPLRGTSHREAGPSGAPGTGGPSGGNFDVPGAPPRAAGFEVGGLPARVAAAGGAPPVRLVIPAIGVSTPLVRLGLEAGGAMAVPDDFGQAGWFAEGPQPGQLGPAVIAGHVDSRTGPAVFYRLRDLRAGNAVLVERADRTRLRFVVERAQSFPKAGFPTAAVFGPVPSAALRLVTCTGDFDRARGSYRDNLVVFARLAGIDGPNRR